MSAGELGTSVAVLLPGSTVVSKVAHAHPSPLSTGACGPPSELDPLKGGFEKPQEAGGANAAFSAENREIAAAEGEGFFKKQDENPDCGGERSVLCPEHPVHEPPALQLQAGDSLALPAAVPFAVGGRPTIFTPQLTEKLCLLLALGFSRNQAAAYLKIDGSSISKACARDKALAEELLRAEQMSGMQPHLTVMAEAQKNWRAAAWFLEHRAKHPLPPPPEPELTEEEKEAQHRINLADQRRRDELFIQTTRAMSHMSVDEPGSSPADPNEAIPGVSYRRKKKVCGK